MTEPAIRDVYWADMITAWRASGLSQKEFCRRQGISDRALNNWLYKSPYRERAARVLAARASDIGHDEASRFVPVAVAATGQDAAPQAVAAAIEVVLPSGPRLVVSPGFDGETLRRVVAALEGRSC